MTAAGRVGVFGGSFDPVHVGHLIVAEILRFRLGLGEVVFLPAGRPPHKPTQVLTSDRDRIRMLELAIDGSAAFSISLVDIERPGWSFTSDSLRMLREVFDSSVELYFLMGQDSLRDFPNWNQPDLIVRHARLGVALRPGVTVSVADVVQRVPAARDRIELVDVPLIGISSRALRDEIARGGPFRFQVVPAVADYIEQHGLYRTGATATSVPREIG